ncbi:hypothetical protein EGR_08571 [Echinococcus granulosus]|uniref:Uncharacterized protein n=1 Tax=Echinococcus granulosus TaxID=6210 RepID=W6U603_ECHGR|nr:hypothetical protein EGR_08571 [Echinococcus granulosus]EUB56545.1 hypothetical protein EGR_08571 [Echinococcus granulosus]
MLHLRSKCTDSLTTNFLKWIHSACTDHKFNFKAESVRISLIPALISPPTGLCFVFPCHLSDDLLNADKSALCEDVIPKRRDKMKNKYRCHIKTNTTVISLDNRHDTIDHATLHVEGDVIVSYTGQWERFQLQ